MTIGNVSSYTYANHGDGPSVIAARFDKVGEYHDMLTPDEFANHIWQVASKAHNESWGLDQVKQALFTSPKSVEPTKTIPATCLSIHSIAGLSEFTIDIYPPFYIPEVHAMLKVVANQIPCVTVVIPDVVKAGKQYLFCDGGYESNDPLLVVANKTGYLPKGKLEHGGLTDRLKYVKANPEYFSVIETSTIQTASHCDANFAQASVEE